MVAVLMSGFYTPGRRVCQSVADSYIRAARSNVSSPNGGPSSCSPTGSPARVNPHGTLTPGMPARFAATVYTSERYIASGSPAYSPALNAAVGVVGPATTSHTPNAAS
jgi:hypothetical protein